MPAHGDLAAESRRAGHLGELARATAVSLHSGGFAKVVPGAELVAAAGK
ncbi:hypothetical protein ACNPQM_10095 [Streptomyces sp. NPDC056231]